MIDDPNDLDHFERRQRFDEIAAEYGRSIAAWECAPWTNEFELLKREGVECPDPKDTAGWGDDEVTTLVWTIIESMARRNCFLSHTDHLSDRELYAKLHDQILDETTKDYATVLDPDELTRRGAWNQHISLCDTGNAEEHDIRAYAMYYVCDDDPERKELAGFLPPSESLPVFREPPHDRDRFLPRSADEWPTDDREETNRWGESDTTPRGFDPDPRRQPDNDGRDVDPADLPF